ncbi:MAG: PLP-dependent transferase [Ignavibacteria bacterium]|jgi:cystathionine beta-lyase|nr:PLP-dependent transferase [Ignavibacteria bacterium]MCU7497863.1 PLP-dependent transferase [Ignavibacteria bacterium]MCU7511144.1 PLP-dependent transferase [Ignavibacteria bacterium]MCU7518691.1 PLP-dependent transferase [Ignavibacteria bacterium]MCU7522906.1 PLP-dependent transferase [Ignavibacteria bacterium]
MELETLLARLTDNCSINDPYGASHLPIYQTATFDLKKQSGDRIYDYSRTDNPTRNALEDIFAAAEGAQGCVCINTGLSAIALLFETTLQTGDAVLVEMDRYGGTYRLLNILSQKSGIDVYSCDFMDHAKVEELIRTKNIRLVFCESPTNPGLKIIDIAAISGICKKYQALFAVDNSLATFASQKPLELGADFSVFSTTKSVSGHGAAVSGAVAAKEMKWVEKLRFYSNAEGRAQSPFESFLITLGLPTLTYRMKVQEENTLKLAAYLSERPDVMKVCFPGLECHPQHALAVKQMKICPGILTVDMINSSQAAKFITNTKYFGEKASFGTVDSRIEMPSKISHHSFTEEDLNAIGITANTLRISVGLENINDLIGDIESALS